MHDTPQSPYQALGSSTEQQHQHLAIDSPEFKLQSQRKKLLSQLSLGSAHNEARLRQMTQIDNKSAKNLIYVPPLVNRSRNSSEGVVKSAQKRHSILDHDKTYKNHASLEKLSPSQRFKKAMLQNRAHDPAVSTEKVTKALASHSPFLNKTLLDGP